MCHVAYTFLKNAEMPNQIMRIASMLGEEKVLFELYYKKLRIIN